jgi:5'-3' exonuclease
MGVPTPNGELRLFDLPAPAGGNGAAPVMRRARGASRRGRRRVPPLLLVVDGNALAHRAFHAVGGTDAPAGDAAERFLSVLARLATSARPSACIVGFDDPVSSLRRQAHPAYKAQRPPKPAALVELLERLPDLLGQIGLCVAVPAGLEADDVLGSAAALALEHGVPATLVTGDRDAFALVRPTIAVWWVGNGGSVQQISPSWLAANYGVTPAAYLDYAALRGDTSDNLPGVRGIGQMTAARLLASYPSVDAALSDLPGLARLLGPYLAHVLVDQRAAFAHNREIMRIRTDVPLDLDAANQPLDPPTVRTALTGAGLPDLADRLLGAFARLGRAAWRARPAAAAAAAPTPAGSAAAEATVPAAGDRGAAP